MDGTEAVIGRGREIDAPRPPLDGQGGVSRQSYLMVVVLAGDFFFLFLLPCFFDECVEEDECLEELDDLPEAVAVEAAGAAPGVSAAIAPATIPKVNNAEAIKVPDLFMGSPTVV
jgi:hypothetical protein